MIQKHDDNIAVDELATAARGMRAYAEAPDTGPELAAALIAAAEKIERFVAVAAECVREIEAAIESLAVVWDRSQLH